MTIFLESLTAKGTNCSREAIHLRVDPCRALRDRLSMDIRRVNNSLHDTLVMRVNVRIKTKGTGRTTHHDFIEPNVPGVCRERFGLRIDDRLLDYAHEFGLEKPLAPFRHTVCFCEHAFAVKFSIFPDFPFDCVFRENMRRVRIRISLPKAL